MPLSEGEILGPYRILAPLGAGGMGEVYRARDPRLDRDVSIKVMPDQLSRDPAARLRFERENKAIAALSHPNIRAIYDFGAEGDRTFAVMELLEGEPLVNRLRQSPLPWVEALRMIIEVADGLAAAHRKNLVHRDIKPGNLFVTTTGSVKILDFGLVRRTTPGADDGGDRTTQPVATREGAVLGTVEYMAPEQVRGEQVDARSDIFALGAVLYEMIEGRPAFAHLVSLSDAIRIEVRAGRPARLGPGAKPTVAGSKPLGAYVQDIAASPEIDLGELRTSLRVSHPFPPFRDLRCRVQPADDDASFTRSQIGEFLFRLEADSPGVTVTSLAIYPFEPGSDVVGDRWRFEAELNLRVRDS